MPVSNNDCVMNRICRKFEEEFDGYIRKHCSETSFDYEIMKSGSEYSRSQYNAIVKLYENYNRRLQSYAVFANYERVDEYDTFSKMTEMKDEFLQACTKICPDRSSLCDIVLDICYRKSSTKRFAWDMCGDGIINNLLKRNGGMISYPTLDTGGNLYYCGNLFSIKHIYLEDVN